MLNLRIILSLSLMTIPALAKNEACQNLWSQHKAEYATYIKNIQPENLSKIQGRLDKSIKGHEAWLKNLNTKVQLDADIKLNLSDVQYKTTLMRETFDSLTKDEKAILFTSKKHLEDLAAARDKDELFEESLTQQYFGVRTNEDKKREGVYKYISSVDDLNWSLVQPTYRLLKKKLRSSENEKTWMDENGIEMEAKVNHFRKTGEFVVSVCSRVDEEKDFPFLKDFDALPPQFGCTRLNLKDNSIEKGMENREEISSPERFQAFLTETFLELHQINPEQCLGYFIDQGQKSGLSAMLSKFGK